MTPPSLMSSPSETLPPRDEVSTTAWRGSPQQGLDRLQITLAPYGIGIAASYAGVRMVRPWAVDVSSGVEVGKGLKDAELMRQFCQAVREADRSCTEAA